MSFQVEDLLGESTRGMQDADLIGAIQSRIPGINRAQAAAVANLLNRGAIRQSSQIGFISIATVTGASLAALIASTGYPISAVSRPQRTFKPCKFFVQQFATIVDSATTPVTISASNATAIDVFLSGSYMGGENAFPNAPTTSLVNGATAVNCSIFNANNLGSGISWTEVRGGIDITLNFLVASTALSFANDATLTGTLTLTLMVTAQLMGPMVIGGG